MIDFKEALKEIFTVEMGSGKELEGLCDGILTSIVEPLDDTYSNFITLGGFSASDVRVGHMQKKFREVELEIECNAVFKKRGVSNPEATAEDNSQKIAKKVRTIIKANQKLVSVTYSSGVAITSEVINEVLDWVQYGNVQCASSIIVLYMKILEES